MAAMANGAAKIGLCEEEDNVIIKKKGRRGWPGGRDRSHSMVPYDTYLALEASKKNKNPRLLLPRLASCFSSPRSLTFLMIRLRPPCVRFIMVAATVENLLTCCNFK